MNQGGWSCPHDRDGLCHIIKEECDPGHKGCVLYGKVKFSSQESPSNEAFEKRMERKMRQLLEEKPTQES
jgi:hypothetical protein